MAGDSSIQWTDATWNPVRGCSRVSSGCEHCYAERQAARFNGPGQPYEGLTRATAHGPVWTGKVRLVPELLDWPLRKRKPLRIFVNSMSDLFHEDVPDEFIAKVFGRMRITPRHTYQILTKRPERMRAWVNQQMPYIGWPLPNVWLGVSVEDLAMADERIPLLLQTPAALRFVSYEPALGPVDFREYLRGPRWFASEQPMNRWLDWLIVGGESGPGARPCDVAWIRSAVKQCRAAGVPVFVKQLGARLRVTGDAQDALGSMLGQRRMERMRDCDGDWRVVLRDRKGGDPSEWPEDLRLREMPEATR